MLLSQNIDSACLAGQPQKMITVMPLAILLFISRKPDNLKSNAIENAKCYEILFAQIFTKVPKYDC
jgi:hypothetical protein